MTKQCHAPGCTGPTTGYSTLCDHHKQAQRRHGHPAQTAVSSQELKPYVALVENRRKKNPSSDAWTILTARWEAIVQRSREVLSRYSSGKPAHRATVAAAHHLKTIADNSESWDVVRTALAMYLLQDAQPRRFRSDSAFDYQLTRRVIRLAPVNAGTYWDNERGKVKKVYRDVPPRVTEAIAASLKEAFGAPGLMLAERERKDRNKVAEEKQTLAAALKDLE
jgi:hypothetical protein